MATTAPTSIGPIGARQINHSLYVGQSDLTTIQKAVTAAARIGGMFVVVIPFSYQGTDTIAAVTGGSADIIIQDVRGAGYQIYYWNAGQYIPADFGQYAGFIATGVPSVIPASSAAFYYDPTGTAGVGTAHINVSANPGMGMPSLNIAGMPSDGTAAKTFARFENSPVGGYPIAGIPQLELPLQLGLFNEDFNHYNLWTGEGYVTGGKGMTVWAKAAENAIDFQGLTIGGGYDQTIRLNYLGGDVQIGPMLFDEAGNITGVTSIDVDSITANIADFNTCEVGNSPVRTFANTPDGPGQGMVWPTDGIAVSLGDHWQDPSIDPASLATWPAVGIPVSTGSAWGTPIDPTTIPRLNAANTYSVYPQSIFDGSTAMSWRGNVPASNIDVTRVGMTTSWNLTQSVGETAFTNVGSLTGSGGFHWYNTWLGGPSLNPANFIMALDSAGNLTVKGGITSSSPLYVNNAGTGNTYGIFNVSPNLAVNSAAYGFSAGMTGAGTSGLMFNGYFVNTGTPANNFGALQMSGGAIVKVTMDGSVTAAWLHATATAAVPTAVGVHAGTRGDGQSGQLALIGQGAANSRLWMIEGFSNAMQFSAMSDDEVTTKNTWFQANRSGTTVTGIVLTAAAINLNGATTLGGVLTTAGSITTSTTNIELNPRGTGSVLLNWNSAGGTGSTIFGNGAVATVGSVDRTGFATFTGLAVSGSKAFHIPHPLDETKDLWHACLEGPENGVFYRGEGVTSEGWAEITLPDYFEALNFPEDRSVLLTALFEDEAEQVGMLAAGRVKDGKFKVWSGLPAQKFYWEVKAVRRIGVERLDVEKIRVIPNPTIMEES